MFPQLQSTLLGWGVPVQMKVISKQPVDFEVQEIVLEIPTIEGMLTVSNPRKVDRKPEGERSWKWWDFVTTSKVQEDTILQDPNGVEFRVTSIADWGQAGFYVLDLAEQPKGTV